jgi:hypothetical protein
VGGRVKTAPRRSSDAPVNEICMARCFFAFIMTGAMLATSAAWADHRCDPIGDPGWKTVPTHELVSQVDGAPYRDGQGWFIDRTVTVLPLCNYFDEIGNYSLRSYSLSPRATTERIGICRIDAAGASVAIPPYAGPCPPK